MALISRATSVNSDDMEDDGCRERTYIFLTKLNMSAADRLSRDEAEEILKKCEPYEMSALRLASKTFMDAWNARFGRRPFATHHVILDDDEEEETQDDCLWPFVLVLHWEKRCSPVPRGETSQRRRRDDEREQRDNDAENCKALVLDLRDVIFDDHPFAHLQHDDCCCFPERRKTTSCSRFLRSRIDSAVRRYPGLFIDGPDRDRPVLFIVIRYSPLMYPAVPWSLPLLPFETKKHRRASAEEFVPPTSEERRAALRFRSSRAILCALTVFLMSVSSETALTGWSIKWPTKTWISTMIVYTAEMHVADSKTTNGRSRQGGAPLGVLADAAALLLSEQAHHRVACHLHSTCRHGMRALLSLMRVGEFLQNQLDRLRRRRRLWDPVATISRHASKLFPYAFGTFSVRTIVTARHSIKHHYAGDESMGANLKSKGLRWIVSFAVLTATEFALLGVHETTTHFRRKRAAYVATLQLSALQHRRPSLCVEGRLHTLSRR